HGVLHFAVTDAGNTVIDTLSLHDALPIYRGRWWQAFLAKLWQPGRAGGQASQDRVRPVPPAVGSRTSKRAPVTVAVPPCSSACCRTRVSPSPDPGLPEIGRAHV